MTEYSTLFGWSGTCWCIIHGLIAGVILAKATDGHLGWWLLGALFFSVSATAYSDARTQEALAAKAALTEGGAGT